MNAERGLLERSQALFPDRSACTIPYGPAGEADNGAHGAAASAAARAFSPAMQRRVQHNLQLASR
jgi:hypothetical protein